MKKSSIYADPGIINRFIRFREKHIAPKQEDAAEKMKIGWSTLWRYETGKTSIPTRVVKQLQEEFKLNAEWLLTGKGKDQVDAKPRTLTTDVGDLRDAIDKLTTQVQILAANLSKSWDVIERQQKEIEAIKNDKK